MITPGKVEEENFRRLWYLETALTRQLIMEMLRYGENDDLHVLRQELLFNHMTIGREFDATLYGDSLGISIARHMTQHTDGTMKIVNALKKEKSSHLGGESGSGDGTETLLYSRHLIEGSWLEDMKEIATYLNSSLMQGKEAKEEETFLFIVNGLLKAHCDATIREITTEINMEHESSERAYKEALFEIDQFALYIMRLMITNLELPVARIDTRDYPPVTMMSHTSGRKRVTK